MIHRIVAIGDVGAAPSFHVGDEAMLEAALLEIGSRLDARWTVVSTCPEETARRYGVEAVDGFGFGELRSSTERDARLEQITDIIEGRVDLRLGGRAAPLLDALVDADAVVITGGGNLNSTWSAHIYERAALAQVAHRLGIPLLVSGQSIGPELTRRDGELASAALTGAQLVGVREEASADLALRLGVPAERIWTTCDDAAFIATKPQPGTLLGLGLEAKRYVAVTVNSFAGLESAAGMVHAYGRLLDQIIDITGLDVLLVPHVGSIDGVEAGGRDDAGRDDVSYHRAVRAAATSPRVRSAPILPGTEVAELTRAAAMVVSNRYHPIVFALSGGVPAIGIIVDAYTENKIRGAARLSGMASWCVSVLGLESGVVAAAVGEAWTRRVEISDRLTESTGHMQKAKSLYWDALADALTGESGATTTLPAVDEQGTADECTAHGPWTVRNDDAFVWSRRFSVRHSEWGRERDLLGEQIHSLSDQLRQERADRCAAAEEVVMLNEALIVERGAVIAAHRLNAELVEKASEAADRQVTFQSMERDSETLAALRDTKLVRWSGPVRSLYGKFLWSRLGEHAQRGDGRPG
ncbi:MAG: hypothetical protein JWM76_1315 [Pseudonocardiales bacterium]|nr:hypothetical protein [Pseudonocardiales bacterium]